MWNSYSYNSIFRDTHATFATPLLKKTWLPLSKQQADREEDMYWSPDQCARVPRKREEFLLGKQRIKHMFGFPLVECLRHGFIGLSHDNFGGIEREIETMLELNDGKITVDWDKPKKKHLQFDRLKAWFPIAIPKHPQTLPKSNDFWCI